MQAVSGRSARAAVAVAAAITAIVVVTAIVLSGSFTQELVLGDEPVAAQPAPDEVYSAPQEAALAWAQQTHPDVTFAVDSLVLIYADDQMVDLRAKITGNGLCAWVSVVGEPKDDKLVWTHGTGTGPGC